MQTGYFFVFVQSNNIIFENRKNEKWHMLHFYIIIALFLQ